LWCGHEHRRGSQGVFAGSGGGIGGVSWLEAQGEEDPMTGVPKLLDKIKTLCRKYSSV
jgi:hypothetical protein